MLVRGDDSRLNRWQVSRHATQLVGKHDACADVPRPWPARCRVEIAVVEAVGQQHDIRGEPITADVAAFPDQFRPSGRQGRGHRTPAERATHVVYAVCAHQDDRSGSAVPTGGAVPVRASAASSRSLSLSPRTSDRVDIQAGKDPAARCLPIDRGPGGVPARFVCQSQLLRARSKAPQGLSQHLPWHRFARDRDAPGAASGGLAELYRPSGPRALVPRPRSGTANLTDSLHGDQAGEQQAPRQVKTKITSARRAGIQQRLERCDIGLGYGEVAGSTAYHQAGLGCDQSRR